jgi:regulatory protein
MVNSLRRRGLSTRAIQAKLQQKGLPADKILAALATFDGEDNKDEAELIAAVQMAKRKRLGCFGKEAPANDPNFGNKQLASLARSGFAFDVAQKALALTQEEAEEILSQRSY